MYKTLQSVKVILLALVLSIGLNYAYAAWSNPTATPPGGNITTPVNIGNNFQTKQGGLLLNELGSYANGLIVRFGNVGIGDTTPDGTLKLDVEGSVGATAYCDQNGSNCTPATALGGGGGGTPLSPEFIRCQVSPGVGSCSIACTAGRVIIAYGLEGTSQDADYTTHSASVSGGNTLNVSQGSMNNEYARYVATCVNPIFAAGNGNYVTHTLYSHNHLNGGGNYAIPGTHKLCTFAGVQQSNSGNGIGGYVAPSTPFDPATGKASWVYYAGGEQNLFRFSCFD